VVAAPPESIIFSVSVTPSTAQVLIDGVTMPSNPFLGHFPKGPGTHHVRAVAPGFQPKERLVTFDDNVMIDLSLNARPAPPTTWQKPAPRRPETAVTRAPAPAPSLAPPPPAAPARASSNDIIPRGEWEPPRRRAIDTNNPYGEEK
jgi:eukaryotic-like serine/threonine-protein kinase